MRVNDPKVTSNVCKCVKYPSESDECFSIDVLNRVAMDKFEETHSEDSLEAALQGVPSREH